LKPHLNGTGVKTIGQIGERPKGDR